MKIIPVEKIEFGYSSNKITYKDNKEVTLLNHKENDENTEIFKVNALYNTLTSIKKLEMLNLLKSWVDNEFILINGAK